jgi:alpha-1,3-rhamnosyl/mannosyltransferase
MRVGVDVTPLLRAKTGIGVFTEMLVRNVIAGGDEVVGLVSGYRLLQKEATTLGIPLAKNWVPRDLNPIFMDILRWPRVETLFGRTDAYFATNHLILPSDRCTNVAFVHDVGRLAQPQLYNPRQVWRFRRGILRCARFADFLIAPTEAVASEIIRLGIAPGHRIRVVLLGVRALPDAPAGSFPDITEHAPFVLCVGSLEKRKNLPFLLRAFAQASHVVPHHLVIAGGKGSDAEGVLAAAKTNGAASRIHFLGHTDEARLAGLYRNAAFTVCPSLYEGFGLPLLEAMASGCPVLATDIAAHREVAADAARLVDPENEKRFAESLIEFARDEGTRADLRTRGLRRSRDFSWDRTSREVRDVLTLLR